MKRKFLILILVIPIVLQLCSFAIVENKKITLDEAIKITLEQNPNIKIEKLKTEISKNEIKSANRLQNPSIGTFQNMGRVGRTEPQQVGADYVIEILKRGKRKSLAQKNSEITQNDQKFFQYNLINEVKKSYVDLILKKANLKIINEQLELSQELYDNLNKEFKKGKIAKTDVIQARIALNRAIMYQNIAKSEVISSQNRLNLTMNTPEINYDTKDDALENNFKNLNTIDPKKPLPDFEVVKNYALNNRQDLIKAQNEIDAAKEKLKIEQSKLIPDLEVTAGWGYQTKGYNSDHTNESGAYAGVSLVDVPLFYRYQPEIKNAKIEIEKAQLSYENTKIDVIRDVTDAWEKFTIARNNLNFYNKELLLDSKELLYESKKSLDKKESDLTGFLVSKKLYLELILGYEEALSEYYISYYDLIKEINSDTLEVENL